MTDLPPPSSTSVHSLLVPPFVACTPAPDEAEPSLIAPGTSALPRVPGYRLLAELGQGGMGVVYKAEQVRLKRLVALKMIRPERASRKMRERFRREAEAVARLQHPNIVQIHEVGDYNDCPFFSLEYMQSGTLADLLDGRPLNPRQAAQFLLPLAQAIHYAHDKGIVHRDLKPANILLQQDQFTTENDKRMEDGGGRMEDGEGAPILHPLSSSSRVFRSEMVLAKIADFGLAKHLDEEVGLSRDGDVLGTPSYMAPEQAGGCAAVGPRCDVYALGAILYELITGRPPFVAVAVEEIVKQVRAQEVVPPRQLVGRLPRDLETICLTCLHKDPARRYASAAALADDLRRFLDGEAIRARPSGRVEKSIRWARRRPVVATLFGCMMLALLTAALAVPFHIHLLNVQVRRGQEEIHRLNRENLRVRVGALLQQGRQARRRRDWEDGRLRFTEIVDSLEASAAWLDDDLLRQGDEARAELAAVDHQLADERASAARRRNYRELFHWRDEAFFLLNRDLFTPSSSSPKESIEAARRGLSLFGIAEEADRLPDLKGYSAGEKEELRGGLFELLLICADAAARTKDGWERALALLHRASRLSAESSIVHARRARYLRQLGRIEEAEGEQRRAESVPPRTALGWFLRGHDLGLDETRRAAAIQAFDEALRRRGDLFWAHFLRALAYQKQGQASEARASLTVCAARRDRFAWNYLLRGLVLIELGDLPAAKADFDKAESLSLDAAARYVLHLNRGTLMLKEKNPQQAKEQFEKAIRALPARYQAHVNLAEACGQLNRFDEAVRHFDEAIRLEPTSARLYRGRALLLQRQGQSSAALADLDRAIRLLPRDPPSLEWARYHFERGAILFLDNRFQAALQALDATLAAIPAKSDRANGERQRLSANAHLLRAQTLRKLNDFPAARAAFDAYLQSARPTAQVWRQRAAVNLKLEDYKAVLEDCSKALGLENDADTLFLRGCAYLRFHLPKSALRDFEAALHLHPKHAEAQVWCALAHLESGDAARGIDEARRAVQLNPHAPEIRLRAAGVFAQAAAKSHDAAGESEALRLLRQAIGLLPTAEEQRAFWSDKVQGDPTLAPLESSAGYRALERRYRSRPQ
jgi:serine/threonine protein kinase/tetratricopeptide (TPR) repeat protein